MEYVSIIERLMEKFGVPGVAMGVAAWFVWKIIQPIINNINQSTKTLIEVSTLLASHNQNAIDMHNTCREHGEYLCDYKDVITQNHKEVMVKLEEIGSDVKHLT